MIHAPNLSHLLLPMTSSSIPRNMITWSLQHE